MNTRISAFLQERIEANDFPSAVYLVAEKGDIVFHDAHGYAVVEPERIEARRDTIYDVASLTKVLVTGLLLAKLLQDDPLLGLGSTIGKLLPNVEQDKGPIEIRDLVAHKSGLRDWYPFYSAYFEPGREFEAAVATSLELPAAYERNEHVVYSDLNFILLAEILRSRTASGNLSELARQELIEPLGLLRTFYNPVARMRPEIAASERGNEYERRTCEEKFPELLIPGSALRDHLIWGEVHDGNAWFMGGAAGHAGLFSTAAEVFKIALQFLPDHTQLLKPETCKLFRTNFTSGLDEDHSFAFQLASTEGSTAGTKMSRESFGHTGFTGTSLWIDPVKDRIFVLLTNRTHNHPIPFTNINSVRRKFHDIAIEELSTR